MSPHTTSGLSVQATALTHSSDKMIPHDREWVLFTTVKWKTFHYLLANYFLLHPVTFWSPRKNTTRCGFLSLQPPRTTAPTMEIHLIQIPWCHRHVKTTQVLIVFGVAAWYVEVDPIFRKTPASSDELISLFSTST